MNGERLIVGKLKNQKNFIPLPYRKVSFQPYSGLMTTEAISTYLQSREVYRRTDIVVLHNDRTAFAVAAVQREQIDMLFTRVEKVEVLALPEKCCFIHAPETDPANRSALAKLAHNHRINPDMTLIVQGSYDHINIIHRPAPLLIRIVEVTPPEPAKLFKMAEQVLSYADLPPIYLELETINLTDLCQEVKPEAFLVPCRSGGLDDLGAPVFFLDERPPERKPWTLIGCERSLQFHRHYYNDEPPRIEMCPRKLTRQLNIPTLLKCCLLEFSIEHEGTTAVVPWGADLSMVEEALALLSQEVEYA